VILAFVVAPMLHGGGRKKGSVKEQVSSGLGSAKEAISKKLGNASSLKADDLDVGKLLPKAREALKALEGLGKDHE
jgi:hypothetical protein